MERMKQFLGQSKLFCCCFVEKSISFLETSIRFSFFMEQTIELFFLLMMYLSPFFSIVVPTKNDKTSVVSPSYIPFLVDFLLRIALLIQLANDVIITAFNWCRCGEEGTWESLSKLLLTKSHVRSSRFLLIESPVIRSHDLKAFNLFENLKLDFTTSNTSIMESFHCHLLSLLNFQ